MLATGTGNGTPPRPFESNSSGYGAARNAKKKKDKKSRNNACHKQTKQNSLADKLTETRVVTVVAEVKRHGS